MMETIISIAVILILAAVLSLLLKKSAPEMALLLTLTAVTVIFLFLAGLFREITVFMVDLAAVSGMDHSLLTPLYKTIGISLIVRIGSSICQDAGESALSAVMETAGSICALMTAIPLFETVLKMLMELMRL